MHRDLWLCFRGLQEEAKQGGPTAGMEGGGGRASALVKGSATTGVDQGFVPAAMAARGLAR